MFIGNVKIERPASYRSSTWCFTFNNYSNDDMEFVKSRIADNCSYGIFSCEVGEEGTPHLQGYVEFQKKCVRKTVINKFVDVRISWRAADGTADQNLAYITKDGDLEFSFGDPALEKTQGKRNDLKLVQELIQNGASELDIAEDYFPLWCQYRRSFDAYFQLRNRSRQRNDLKVYVLVGTSGVGKTRLSVSFTEDYWINSDPTLQWFDGYRGQTLAILDEYRGDCKNPAWILRVLDIYKLDVQIKGGFVSWTPQIIILSSNVNPNMWHMDIQAPLMRRITEVFHLTDEDEGVELERARQVIGLNFV